MRIFIFGLSGAVAMGGLINAGIAIIHPSWAAFYSALVSGGVAAMLFAVASE